MKKTIFGLILSLVIPAFYVLFINPVLVKPNVPVQASILLGFAVLWALAAGVLVYTRTVERLPLATIGWKPLPWKQALLAVGLGIALSLLVPVLTLLTSRVFPPANTGTVTQVATSSTWWILLISVFTAGITEEILFRGYALERLEGLTKNRWVSGLVSLAFFCEHPRRGLEYRPYHRGCHSARGNSDGALLLETKPAVRDDRSRAH